MLINPHPSPSPIEGAGLAVKPYNGGNEMINTIIRSPEGTERREVEVDRIQVPDLWHVAMYVKDQGNTQWAEQILDCWHLTHDLITNIQAHNNNIKL